MRWMISGFARCVQPEFGNVLHDFGFLVRSRTGLH